MTILSALAITTALTAYTSAAVAAGLRSVSGLALVIDFVYGSAGTSGKIWVQTSLDGGTTWIDIACMTFTTASKKRVHNLSAATAITTPYTATDGTLTDDTTKDGVLGALYRTKITTIGTYVASTLSVSAVTR